jgi:polyhydroxyalkanoic acid synthase PhaR subunit
MSEETNSQDGNKIIFPDFAELWKELYFKTESAWADAFREYISTDTFVKMLDQSLNQHLSIEKITRQNIDKLFEYGVVPSKKDLARVAELVISVEEKVDYLDDQLVDNINKMADSLLRMLTFLEAGQKQISAMKEQIAEVSKQNADIKKQNVELKNQLNELKAQLTSKKVNEAGPENTEETASKSRSKKKNAAAENIEQTDAEQGS